jgi:cation:H+ antiporter
VYGLTIVAAAFVFSLKAGQIHGETGECAAGPDGANPCALALASMTGANRVLVGVGVNQWTLLVGTIPIVFAVAARTFDGLPLDTHQRLELLLTATQSLFAVSILVTLGITVWGAAALFVLFAVRFFASIILPAETRRVVALVMLAVYALLAVAQFVRHRGELVRTTRDGLITPFDQLEKADQVAK